jgi:hypothetical protein
MDRTVGQARGRRAAQRQRVRRFRPVLLFITVTARLAPNLGPRVQKALIRRTYQGLNSPRYIGTATFMNYGYAPAAEVGASPVDGLALDEQAERFSIRLYAEVAGRVDLSDRDLLEVGCGPGGGVSSLQRGSGARSVTGIDFAEKAITSATRRHRGTGVRFLAADAESLPFRSRSFDAAINVESSHCYPRPGPLLRRGGAGPPSWWILPVRRFSAPWTTSPRSGTSWPRPGWCFTRRSGSHPTWSGRSSSIQAGAGP